MTIETFAKEYGLRLAKIGSGSDVEVVVEGRIGHSQIYQHSDTELGVILVTDGKKPPRTGLFNSFKAACLEVGMKCRQIGDAEGAFSFNPMNPKQAKVAIKGIRAKAKRRISPEMAAAGAARLAAARTSRFPVQIHT
jgi:hypothetical protein